MVQLEAAHERLRLQSRLAETEADSRSAREEASTLVREGDREGGGGSSAVVDYIQYTCREYFRQENEF